MTGVNAADIFVIRYKMHQKHQQYPSCREIVGVDPDKMFFLIYEHKYLVIVSENHAKYWTHATLQRDCTIYSNNDLWEAGGMKGARRVCAAYRACRRARSGCCVAARIAQGVQGNTGAYHDNY